MHSTIYRAAGTHAGAPIRLEHPEEAPRGRAPGFHYKPAHGHETDDAICFVDSLVAKLAPWLATAAAIGFTRPPEEMRCDLAGALSRLAAWEGSAVAEQLRPLGWPVDAELASTVHRWSCALHREKYEKWIAAREQKRQQRRARRGTS